MCVSAFTLICVTVAHNQTNHAEAASLHDILEQLAPISEQHGLSAVGGMTDLIKQHKEVQQQITEAQERAAKLEIVAELEKRQAHFEACLSAGESHSCLQLPALHTCRLTTSSSSSSSSSSRRRRGMVVQASASQQG